MRADSRDMRERWFNFIDKDFRKLGDTHNTLQHWVKNLAKVVSGISFQV